MMNKFSIERVVMIARSINWNVVKASPEEKENLEKALQAVEAADYSPNKPELLERLAGELEALSEHPVPQNRWLAELASRLTDPLHGAYRCPHCHEWV